MSTNPSAVQYLPLSGGTLSGGLAITGSFPAGNMVTLTNTASGPSDADLVVIGQTSGDRGIGVRTTGDTFSRVLFGTDGSQKQSPGNAGADVTQIRTGAALFGLTATDLDVNTSGHGLRVAEGSNAKQGTATLAAGTVTVSNTAVTANSRIFLTSQADGGTPGFVRVSARVAGTSFTITSSSGTDTSTIAYEIIEPG